jgi:CelD/BcsL family acetyltransferase involved in cellulose biosynthesis
MLNADWLTDEVAITELAPAWDRLAMEADPNSLFLRSGWFAAAWNWCSASCTLAILRIRQGEQLVALLPMKRETAITRWPLRSYLSSLDVPDTQQYGLLCARDAARAVSECVAEALREAAESYDRLQLRKLHAMPSNDALIVAMRRIPRTSVSVADVCPCIQLDTDWQSYYALRSRRLKKGNNLLANRLKKSFGSISVSRETLDDSERGAALLRELLAVSAHSWKRELKTALYQPVGTSWINELCRQFGSTGEIAVWSLRLDGLMVATEIQIDHGGTVSALRADVRREYEEFGVGTYLNWKVAEGLLGTGRRLYNMGPGVNAYKERWSDLVLEPKMVTGYGSGLRGRVAWLRDCYFAGLKRSAANMLRREERA